MMNSRHLWGASALATALALTGCGGGDDNVVTPATPTPTPTPTPATEVPDTAGVSVTAFVSFILGLTANDESSEPLTLKDTFAVPADETAEPTPLI